MSSLEPLLVTLSCIALIAMVFDLLAYEERP